MVTESKLKRRLTPKAAWNFIMSDDVAYWRMLLPFLIFFFIFMVLPVMISLYFGFTDYDMLSTPKFIGLDNYKRMFTSDDMFPTVVKNTIVYAIVTGPLGFIFAFVLAWFISEFDKTVRNILAFLFYAPALTGNALYIWQVAFSGEAYGYVNSALLSLGIITEPIVWFKSTEYAFPIVVIIQLWMSMGVGFLSDIAGLQNVSPELYEAGAIDGIRSRWHELWYITLPGMKHILLFGAVMQIQSSFSAGATIQALCGYPSTNNSMDQIVTYMSDIGNTRYELGYAAAITLFLFGMMAISRLIIGKLLDGLGK